MADPHPDDDRSIPDEEDLWRRITPDWVVKDDDGVPRVTSQAFQNDSEGKPMSVHLSSVAEEMGRSPGDVLKPFPGYSLASITAGLAREQRQGVKRGPEPPDDLDHGSVVGKKTGAVRKAFRKAARWIIPPP